MARIAPRLAIAPWIALCSLISPESAFCQVYFPIGDFTYKMPDKNNSDFMTSSDATDTIAAASAATLANGYYRQMTQATIISIKTADSKLTPIRSALGDISSDQYHSDSTAARADAAKAQSLLNTFKSGKDLGAIKTFAANANPNQSLFDLVSSFYKYEALLEQSVSDAQSVPSRIDKYLNDDVAGNALLSSAASFQASQYRAGMKCNILIVQAARQSSMVILGGTTTYWFANGLGQGFRQIYGGADGLPLQQLVDDTTTRTPPLSIPKGSVIVADGHAALFVGTIKIAGKWELLLYDANDSDGWTTSFDGLSSPAGSPQSPIDLPPSQIAFPGHQVGLHVTWLQWNNSRPVKVFQPVADPPPGHGF